MSDVIGRHEVVAWLDNIGYPKLADIVNDKKRFPFAEPERKTGKWLMNGERYGHMYWRCSQCEEEVDYIGAKFCPNCGSFNGGEKDE